MIEAVRQYIISIISASVVCALFKGLLSKSAYAKIVHVLCGTILLFTFLGPVKNIDLTNMVESIHWDESTAREAVHRGEELTQNAMADIISAEIAAYVEEKANTLGAEVRIEVQLSAEEIPVPVGMELTGNVSPYVRRQLEAYIAENIGLEGEDVRWISKD